MHSRASISAALPSLVDGAAASARSPKGCCWPSGSCTWTALLLLLLLCAQCQRRGSTKRLQPPGSLSPQSRRAPERKNAFGGQPELPSKPPHSRDAAELTARGRGGHSWDEKRTRALTLCVRARAASAVADRAHNCGARYSYGGTHKTPYSTEPLTLLGAPKYYMMGTGRGNHSQWAGTRRREPPARPRDNRLTDAACTRRTPFRS